MTTAPSALGCAPSNFHCICTGKKPADVEPWAPDNGQHRFSLGLCISLGSCPASFDQPCATIQTGCRCFRNKDMDCMAVEASRSSRTAPRPTMGFFSSVYGVMEGEIPHYVLRFRSSQPPLSSNTAVQRCCAHLPASPMPIGVILCPQFHYRTPCRRLNCSSASTLIPFDLGPLCSHQAIKPASASKIWAISGQLPCPPAVG